MSSSSCLEKCGEIPIPYPFGVGERCFHDRGFEIECKNMSGESIPFLSCTNQEVVDIALPSQDVNGSIVIKSYLNEEGFESLLNLTTLKNTQWYQEKHYALLKLEWFFRATNISFMASLACIDKLTCRCEVKPDYGINCECLKGYRGNPFLDDCQDIDECKEITSGGSEYCPSGWHCKNLQGSYSCDMAFSLENLSPYGILLLVGSGLFVLVGVGLLCMKFIRRRMRIKRRKNLFRRNGGLLLKQQLTANEGSIEATRIFSSKELAKATENFSETRILGKGGQGTVYKGMLRDGKIVAVKKSTTIDEEKVDEFINEVVILSQIKHRNIVQLLGCCLETDVPLLVYEFISNGNLFEHLHDEYGDQTMVPWEPRLRVAIEMSGALSYLHSAASIPIYHRDIKTANIMLDERFRAKVSDFGMSRSVSEDQTHITTQVAGTAGYLDPEYYQSSQFMDKSDVYSFGVVLVELMTGQKPVCFTRSPENRTLATFFNHAMKENKLVEIIDPRITSNCKLEQVMAVAQVAKRCLNLKRSKRPNMKHVLMDLEMIRSSPEKLKAHVYQRENEEEIEEGAVEVYIGIESRNKVALTAPVSQHNGAASTSSSWSQTEPLFPLRTM